MRQRAERWERYRSNIAEAAAAQQLQNSSTGERALEAAPEECRNWEWRHLDSQLDGASLVLSVPEINYLRNRTGVTSRLWFEYDSWPSLRTRPSGRAT